MQIFELYFNPKLNEDLFFDSFIYEPENVYERKLGNLYAVGELKNALPQNSRLLDNLTNVIKERYYNISFNIPERAISESLKKANEFLADEVKKENVSWLGNLDFALISIKNFDLVFTKTGDIKILLIRGGQIIDIGKNLDIQDIDPYPLKIFFNIVSGKLVVNDAILVITKDLYNFFLRKNIIKRIAQCEILNKKRMKEILPQFLLIKEENKEISGVCFLTVLNREITVLEKSKEIFFKKGKEFSFSEILAPLKKLFSPLNLTKKLSFIKIKKIRKFKKIPLSKKSSKKTGKKNILFPTFKELLKTPSFLRKKIILILIFLFFLLLGYLIF